ncbi:unnamed protein product [Linum trigynum]|uniref:Mitochondrial protein n=1 Tax=Linum trigynum TaxID=586398 RepID=A0AAV2GTX6_9ROSI
MSAHYDTPSWIAITTPPITILHLLNSPNHPKAPPPTALSPISPPAHNRSAASTSGVSPDATSSSHRQDPPPPPTKAPRRLAPRSQHGIFCPKKLFASQVGPPVEPTSVRQALKDPRWNAAMRAEFHALLLML